MENWKKLSFSQVAILKLARSLFALLRTQNNVKILNDKKNFLFTNKLNTSLKIFAYPYNIHRLSRMQIYIQLCTHALVESVAVLRFIGRAYGGKRFIKIQFFYLYYINNNNYNKTVYYLE